MPPLLLSLRVWQIKYTTRCVGCIFEASHLAILTQMDACLQSIERLMVKYSSSLILLWMQSLQF